MGTLEHTWLLRAVGAPYGETEELLDCEYFTTTVLGGRLDQFPKELEPVEKLDIVKPAALSRQIPAYNLKQMVIQHHVIPLGGGPSSVLAHIRTGKLGMFCTALILLLPMMQ